MGYTLGKRIRATHFYVAWLNGLKDRAGRARILVRVDRLAHGNPGLHKRISAKVCELKIDVGPGYRVYYTEVGNELILLLCGGDKRSQRKDIQTAISLANLVQAEDS
jgi:putative addiction module killer protein